MRRTGYWIFGRMETQGAAIRWIVIGMDHERKYTGGRRGEGKKEDD